MATDKKLFQEHEWKGVMKTALFIGIDIGTQGARVVLTDELGKQLGVKEEVFPLSSCSREEQDPHQWWASCKKSLQALCREAGAIINQVKAIGVTSTSGTIIPLDKNNQPLHPAIMYSDGRSSAEAVICKDAALA